MYTFIKGLCSIYIYIHIYINIYSYIVTIYAYPYQRFIYLYICYNHICISLSKVYIGLPFMYILIKGLYRSFVSFRESLIMNDNYLCLFSFIIIIPNFQLKKCISGSSPRDLSPGVGLPLGLAVEDYTDSFF